jgi:hypothetical protein
MKSVDQVREQFKQSEARLRKENTELIAQHIAELKQAVSDAITSPGVATADESGALVVPLAGARVALGAVDILDVEDDEPVDQVAHAEA